MGWGGVTAALGNDYTRGLAMRGVSWGSMLLHCRQFRDSMTSVSVNSSYWPPWATYGLDSIQIQLSSLSFSLQAIFISYLIWSLHPAWRIPNTLSPIPHFLPRKVLSVLLKISWFIPEYMQISMFNVHYTVDRFFIDLLVRRVDGPKIDWTILKLIS